LTAGRADEGRTGPARLGFLAKLAGWGRRGKEDAGRGKDAQPLSLLARDARESAPPLDGPTLAQWLWGAGFHIPGGDEHVLDLVKPFALNPAMSMLYIGAGLGGGARAIATKFATYVTALESDEALARRGMEMSTLHGMQKHAPVSVYDPRTLELRPHSFDGILSRQSTYTLADKEPFLQILVTALKPRGHLLVTDYVLEPKVHAGPELEAWRRLQRRPAHLWSAAQYADCLKHLGLEIRVTEDTTSTLRHRILAGWAQLIGTVDLRSLPRQHLLAVVDEAERWVRTIAALDGGALRTYRIYALAGTGGARK
jgi:SAM-dependent methyltransferase